MAKNVVKINRAPVMTLWEAVVAERLGFDRDEALTLGRSVAGLNAQAKGRSLGIFKPAEKPARQEHAARKMDEDFFVELLGRHVPARKTKDGIRAIAKDAVVEPAPVQRYQAGKFGDRLDEVRSAMDDLARTYEPQDLAERAYGLYEQFRPQIAGGTRGWGQAGDLDLDLVRSLVGKA
jgi:hypothetical protein